MIKRIGKWMLNTYRSFKYRLGFIVYTTEGGMVQIVGKGPNLYLGTIVGYENNELVYICPDIIFYYNAAGELIQPTSLKDINRYNKLSLTTFKVKY